jgi:ABC-type transport system involved in multi-copper enzyme maturation permease subunit
MLGPVFNAELMTTARRARYYIIRFIYGSIILFQIYTTYESNRWQFTAGGGQMYTNQLAMFALQLFSTFAVVQAAVVLLLTPALVGGTIADERQRKTLHYLLTSELSSAEIILSKLGARLLQVCVLVALGLPVVSLMGLFGGIDIRILLVVYAATFTTMFFLASGSIFISVISRRPREAISLIYILEVVWLFVPWALMNAMARGEEPWPKIAEWVNPVLQYVAMTSPFYASWAAPFTGTSSQLSLVYWGMGLQVAYGVLFVFLAAIRLRPSARTEGSTSSLSRWFKKLVQKRKWLPRRPCGDDGMLWKEMYVSRTGGLTKAVMVLLGVSLVGLILYTGFDMFIAAWDEMWREGYFTRGDSRTSFNYFLRSFSTGIYVLWFLGIASGAATGICSEREEDQWLSLTATPLSGREIIRAKMIGPVWGLWPLAILLFTIWTLGLLVGSIHPLGVLACLVELVIFTWFLTALGTLLSLKSKNSTRALASTMAILIFINGAYMFCCIPLQPNGPIIAGGCTPFVFAVSLFSNQDLYNIGLNRPYDQTGQVIAACVICVLFYGIAAAGLTTAVFSIFDSVVDRPDRLRQIRTSRQQQEYLKGREKDITWNEI